MNMYNALVMPYFKYCSTVWGNIGKKLLDKIKKKTAKQGFKAGYIFTSYPPYPYPSECTLVMCNAICGVMVGAQQIET